MNNDAFVPMAQWAKDHWSTFAYVDAVMVDCGGFQVGLDPRMKANRRHFRVMGEECQRPRRPSGGGASMAIAMAPEHATRLKNGTTVAGHDDWMCLQDMAEAGLFADGSEVRPGETLHLSPKGRALIAALREHKAGGGNFASFEPAAELQTA